MKKFNKTILAAALMVAAGSANAALTSDATDGSNEAYLVAFDAGYINSDATLGRTFNLDLGTTFAALKANAGTALAAFAGAGKSLSSDANWNTFRGVGATSLVTYGVYAAGDTVNQPTNGVFLSGLSAPTAPALAAGSTTTPAGSTVTWGTSITAINQHAVEINKGLAVGATSSVIKGTDTASSGQADSVPTFDSVWGAGSFNPLAAYGTSDNFYEGMTHLGDVTVTRTHKTTTGVALLAQSDINLIGAFTLAGNTLSYAPAVSSVPLPAAVWLFGAGLMGVLRLNRRKSVQA